MDRSLPSLTALAVSSTRPKLSAMPGVSSALPVNRPAPVALPQPSSISPPTPNASVGMSAPACQRW